MEVWNATPEILQVVWNIALIVLSTLATAAAAGALGGGAIKAARWAWQQARPMLDEPTDPAVEYIAKKSGRAPKAVSEFIIARGDEIIALLPKEAEVPGEPE